MAPLLPSPSTYRLLLTRPIRHGAYQRTLTTSSSSSSSSSSNSPTTSPVSVSAAAAAEQLLHTFQNKTITLRQTLDSHQLQKLSLTLTRPILHPDGDGPSLLTTSPPPNGTPLPPGYHLAYFTPASLEADLGPDGTDRTFNAPAPFTRRMWAGGRMTWTPGCPLRVGQEVEERTRLVGATPKVSGRDGSEMVLVEVEKEFWGPQGLALVDRRSWIFRPPPGGALARSDAHVNGLVPVAVGRCSQVKDVRGEEGDVPQRHFSWSPVALFRFSALTFNAHMIHYNECWTKNVEGHPAVVVHGPLNLIGMMDYWRDVHANGREAGEITYRALSPLYAGEEYVIRTEESSSAAAVTENGEEGEPRRRSWELAVVRGDKKCMKGTILAAA